MASYLLILIIFLGCMALLFSLPPELSKIYSEVYYNIALGTGAIITAVVGGKFLWEQIERRDKRKFYTNRYPISDFGTKYLVIESTTAPGAIYLYEKSRNLKHHIWNMKTVYDLGWHVVKRETIQDAIFSKIDTGEPIRTWGELGE